MSTLLDGRYRLRRRLGDGPGAGNWLAEDEHLHRRVVVHLFAAGARDPSVVAARARRLAQLTCLNHPALVSAFDASDPTDPAGPSFLVTELVDG